MIMGNGCFGNVCKFICLVNSFGFFLTFNILNKGCQRDFSFVQNEMINLGVILVILRKKWSSGYYFYFVFHTAINYFIHRFFLDVHGAKENIIRPDYILIG